MVKKEEVLLNQQFSHFECSFDVATMSTMAINTSNTCSANISPIVSIDISIFFTFSDRMLVCEFIYVLRI